MRRGKWYWFSLSNFNFMIAAICTSEESNEVNSRHRWEIHFEIFWETYYFWVLKVTFCASFGKIAFYFLSIDFRFSSSLLKKYDNNNNNVCKLFSRCKPVTFIWETQDKWTVVLINSENKFNSKKDDLLCWKWLPIVHWASGMVEYMYNTNDINKNCSIHLLLKIKMFFFCVKLQFCKMRAVSCMQWVDDWSQTSSLISIIWNLNRIVKKHILYPWGRRKEWKFSAFSKSTKQREKRLERWVQKR